jgi:hypothetical protein
MEELKIGLSRVPYTIRNEKGGGSVVFPFTAEYERELIMATITRPTDPGMDKVEAVATNLATPAVTSSLKFLRGRYQRARCDSEAVADCVRCQTMFLVRTLEDTRAAIAAMGHTPPSGEDGDALQGIGGRDAEEAAHS